MLARFALVFAMLLLLAAPVVADQTVLEQLRLGVPADQREVWLKGEQLTWQPWLEAQDGFLGRDLYWDPSRQEGLLLIRWASREQWKSIPAEEVQLVQNRFDAVVNQALGRVASAESPFPLLAEGELQIQDLPD